MTQQGNNSLDCHGNGAVHCCYIPGTGIPDPATGQGDVCWFLEQGTIPGRNWVCGLRRQMPWAKVHHDPRYQKVADVLTEHGSALCGEWRVAGQCCYGADNPPVYNQ